MDDLQDAIALPKPQTRRGDVSSPTGGLVLPPTASMEAAGLPNPARPDRELLDRVLETLRRL